MYHNNRSTAPRLALSQVFMAGLSLVCVSPVVAQETQVETIEESVAEPVDEFVKKPVEKVFSSSRTSPMAALRDALQQSDPIAALQALVLEQPGFSAAQYNLGVLLYEAEDFAAASAAFAIAAEASNPALAADAWFNQSLSLVAQGQWAQAVAAIEQALTLQPDNADIAEQRQRIQRYYLQRQEAARLAAERALQLATKELAPAWVGKAYQQQIVAKGGAGGPYTIALASDTTLPQGLVLTAEGSLQGTPEQAGVVPVDLVLLDQGVAEDEDESKGKAKQSLPLQVLPAPNLLTQQLPPALLNQPYQATLQAERFYRPRVADQWSA